MPKKGEVYTQKICKDCNKLKQRVEFIGINTKRKVPYNICRSCRNIKARRFRTENRGEYRAMKRKHNLLKNFNLTVEQYDELLKKQGGLCAICHREEICKKRLAVDHDHNTGRIRGLLCSNCNRAIGQFGDNIEIMKNAIYYLEANKL